jgi:5-methylcytosine-specific restriction endonuclease McrA
MGLMVTERRKAYLREYQRKWIAARRAEWFLDKYCVKCGSIDDLEIDHIDSSTKISNSIWSWSAVRRDAELAKCQVLCHKCHWEKTLEFDRHKTSHGTGHMYQIYNVVVLNVVNTSD